MMKRLAHILIPVLIIGCKAVSPPSPEMASEPQLHPPSDVGQDQSPDVLPSGPDTITVATFNVALFFDTRCDSGECGSQDWEQQPSVAQFEARARVLSRAIRRLEADVVLLQELETQESLDALQQRLDDLYQVSVIGETGSPGSIDVAVLSKGEKLNVITHRHNRFVRSDGQGTDRFSREFLEVQLRFGDKKLVVFTAHFKSKNNDDAPRRLGEAIKAKEILLEAMKREPDAMIILGGDLNDVPGSPPLNALEDGGFLLRAAADVGLDRAWTYKYRDQLNELDHLYLAVGSGRYNSGTAEARRDHDRGLGGSDHAALVAKFSFK